MVLPGTKQQPVSYLGIYQDVIADRRLGVHPEIFKRGKIDQRVVILMVQNVTWNSAVKLYW